MAATGGARQEQQHHGHLLIKSRTEVTGTDFGLIPCAMQALDTHTPTSKLNCYLVFETWGIL